MDDERVGRFVRAYRAALGLTQSELGARLGVTHAAVSDIERGQTHITLALLSRLAAALNVEPLALINGATVQGVAQRDALYHALRTLAIRSHLLGQQEVRAGFPTLDAEIEQVVMMARREVEREGGTVERTSAGRGG